MEENKRLKAQLVALEKAHVALQNDHELLKAQIGHDKSKKTRNRHSKEFWDDIEAKLKNATDSVKALIKDKVILMDDVNDAGWTLLQFASYIGNYSITQLCINLGADVNHKNDDGNTALLESQQGMMSHTEELLLFNEMEASIGDRIKNVSFDINKQNGIIENSLNELSLIGVQSKQLYAKLSIELMVNCINKKETFSDDLLNLCWSFQELKGGDISSSELWIALKNACLEVIQNRNKRDWFWFKKCVLPSKIWYRVTDQFVETDDREQKEEKRSEKNRKKTYTKVRQYLYYEMLYMVKTEAQKQLNILIENLKLDAGKDLNAWQDLVEWDIDKEQLTEIESSIPRQDNIPNGISAEFTSNALNYDASNDKFDGAKFYDHHQYLSKVLLLAQMVDDKFHKSIMSIFNVNKYTNIGMIDKSINVVYRRGPVKLLERARSKAENDYFAESYPTSACVLDLNRCCLIFNDIQGLLIALQLFINKVRSYQSGSIIGIVRIKNGFKEYVLLHKYADIKLNVLIKGTTNNIIGEVQFSLQTMIDYKTAAHNLYAIEREETFITNSEKILPSLLDCDTQLKVYAAMGDVRGLCGLMVFNNKSQKDINIVDKAEHTSILGPICDGGKLKAFRFIVSLLKDKNELMDHLFREDEFEFTPVEYAIRNNHLSIIQDILTIDDVCNRYKKEAQWRYRLVFHLFSACWNTEIIDYILNTVDIKQNNDDILDIMEYEYPDEESQYFQDSIIVLMVMSNNINVLKKLSHILGEKHFIQNVLVVDGMDRNALEAAVADGKFIHIECLLSFKEIVNEYIYNKDDEETKKCIYRILYLLFVHCNNEKIIEFVLNQLNITNEIIAEIVEFKYPKPSEDDEFDADAYRYYTWDIKSDAEVVKLLNTKKQLVRMKSV